jgi:hypothetical protein
MRDGNVVKRPALFLGEQLQNVARRHAAKRVKAVFRKMQVVALGNDLPSVPAQRHGVGQRAVAVENQTLDCFHSMSCEGREEK